MPKKIELPTETTWKESGKGLILWLVVMILLLIWMSTMTTIAIEHWVAMVVMLGLPAIAIFCGMKKGRS